MGKKGENGEPWEAEELSMPPEDCTGGGILAMRPPTKQHIDELVWIGDFEERRDRDRAIACVNALDGKNPEALEEFVEAAKDIRMLAAAPRSLCGQTKTPLGIVGCFDDALAELEESHE